MNKRILFTGYMIGSLLLPMLVYGDVYQWVDEKGQVHFGNIPPKQQGPYKLGGYGNVSPNSASTQNMQSGVPVQTPQPVPSAAPTAKPQTGPIVKTKAVMDAAASAVNPDSKSTDSKAQSKSKSKPKTKPASESQSKAKSAPKAKQLEVLIKRLRTEAGTPQAKPAASPSERSPQQSAIKKPATTSSPKLVKHAAPSAVHAQKNQKKQDKKPDKKPDKKQEKKKETSGAVVTKLNHTTEKSTSDSKDEKDADKCGVFTNFVIAYEVKVKDGCPGAHCSMYKRSLKKYKLKKERYCLP